jgi:hypothetical protein
LFPAGGGRHVAAGKNWPVRSPDSNGMAEASAKTFKCDYVGYRVCPDTRTVMKNVSAWIEGCNGNAPHKGLRMCSPREFIRLLPTAECPV